MVLTEAEIVSPDFFNKKAYSISVTHSVRKKDVVFIKFGLPVYNKKLMGWSKCKVCFAGNGAELYVTQRSMPLS